MLINLLEYNWAEDLDEALILLGRSDVKTVALAGGTSLLGRDDETIQAVVDLRDLELTYIEEDPRNSQSSFASGASARRTEPGLRIGAMATLQMLAEAPLLREGALNVLSLAAGVSASSRLIRNSATLGGTLALGADSRADLLTALAVLGVEVVLRSGSRTQLDLAGGTPERPGFALPGVVFKGKQERRISFATLSAERRANELIIEIVLPRPAHGCGGAFLRVGRTPTDVALLNAAALVEVRAEVYQHVRLALGGVNMEPVRLTAVERQLEGQPVTNGRQSNSGLDVQRLAQVLQAGMANFQPPADIRASSGYRRVVGMNLAFRALEEATNVSRWRNMVSEGK
ncbi:MAG TPA: FAD binding domain-containing protein [Ktedonobacteraceae bacterium]